MTNDTNLRRGRWPLLLRSLSVFAVAGTVAGCELGGLLDVDDPEVLDPVRVEDPSNLTAIHAGVIGDFAVAYTGYNATNGEGQILISGLLADEFYHSGTFGTRREMDRRSIQANNASAQTVFRTLHRARAAAERAGDIYAGAGVNSGAHAEVLNLAGFSYILFGENYCSGVPFSTVTATGELQYGQPLPTAGVFERAIEQFDAAIQVANAALAGTSAANRAGAEAQRNLARVGKARALLNLNRVEEAAAVAREVPTGFSYAIGHSANTARQQNGVFYFANEVRRWAIASGEGRNGLEFRGDDPRVPWRQPLNAQGQPIRGFDATVLFYEPLKYPTRESSVPLGTGIEARLIEAEAALRAGDVVNFLRLHNEARATRQLAPLVAAGLSQAALVDVHFRERAFWMYATSHRLGDLRRLVRQYGRSQDQVFPTGTYQRPGGQPDGVYGTDVNFPVPVDELNNPNFEACINRDA